MRPVDSDPYGCTIAVVIPLSDRSPNRGLVELRMALWYRKYAPADTKLGRLEADVRAG